MGEQPRAAVSGLRRFGLLSAVDALLGLLALALFLAAAGTLLYATVLSIDQVLTPTEDGMARHDSVLALLTALGWASGGAGLVMLLVDLPVFVLSVPRSRTGHPSRLTAILSLIAVGAGSFLPLALIALVWAAWTFQGEAVLFLLALMLAGVLLAIVPLVRLAQLVSGVLDLVRRRSADTG